MARPKKYNISLTDDELKELKSVMRKKQTSKTVRNRCQIIVDLDDARRKFDGRAEARIIETACSPAPEGHSRWTLRLLEEQAKIVLDVPVSKDTIGRALKKTNFDLT